MVGWNGGPRKVGLNSSVMALFGVHRKKSKGKMLAIVESHVSKTEAVKKPSTELIDRRAKQGKLRA
jgi:hypothetical protein